jgi:pimeloyl-ACP methyl ester carboxylesterase
MEQEIRFCTTSDNVKIAYASVGSGLPFVKSANWLNHLEADWRSPIWRHLLDEFSRDQMLLRYDERGNGLSDWKVSDISQEAFVSDLESVIDAAGINQFPLLGISQGGAVAIEYAVRHPDKVTHLILLGAFARGWRKMDLPPNVAAKREAQLALIRSGWGNENPATRQFFTTLVIPDGAADEMRSFNEMQRVCTSPDNAARLFEAFGNIDVVELLPQVRVPTIVFHSRHDAVINFEDGRRIAAAIPGAKFVLLESNNHLLLSNEPAWHVFVDEVRRFIGRPAAKTDVDTHAYEFKKCPECQKVYRDKTINFCLDDGSRLVETLRDEPAENEQTRLISK